MPPATRGAPHRWFPAFLVTGLILGTFAYLVLIAILPFLFGPWALVVAGLVGAEILLAHHRHLRHARTGTRIVWGRPAKGSAVRRPRDRTEAYVVGTFLIVVFALVVYSVGTWIRFTTWAPTVDFPWYVVGLVLTRLGIAILFSLGVWIFPFSHMGWLPSESELFDTTDDH